MTLTRTNLLLIAIGVCWCVSSARAQVVGPSPLGASPSEVVTGNAATAIEFANPNREPLGQSAIDGQTQTEIAATATAETSTPPLQLAKPGQGGAPQNSQTSAGLRAPPSRANSIGTVISSLVIVLGLFFGIVWVAKRHAPKGSAMLPSDVVESLGRAPLAGRQQMQLVRVGQKLLLVAVSPTGAQTLTEVTDPDEVKRLTAICEDGRSGSATGSFRQALGELSNESTPRGFFGRLAGTGDDASVRTGGVT